MCDRASHLSPAHCSKGGPVGFGVVDLFVEAVHGGEELVFVARLDVDRLVLLHPRPDVTALCTTKHTHTHSGVSKAGQLSQQLYTATLIKMYSAPNIKKRDHMTHALDQLHWCSRRAEGEALHNQAPGYLRQLIIPYALIRQLCSRDTNLLLVPRSKTKT